MLNIFSQPCSKKSISKFAPSWMTFTMGTAFFLGNFCRIPVLRHYLHTFCNGSLSLDASGELQPFFEKSVSSVPLLICFFFFVFQNIFCHWHMIDQTNTSPVDIVPQRSGFALLLIYFFFQQWSFFIFITFLFCCGQADRSNLQPR